MERKVILFDIDNTIFNHVKFGKERNEQISKSFLILPEKVDELNKGYLSTLKNEKYFNPKDFCEYFSERTNHHSSLIYKEAFNKPATYKKSLYKDTKISLIELDKAGYKLGIYSEGFKYFQILKLKNSNIFELFDNKLIFISRNKTQKAVINKLPKMAILVDDKLSVLETVNSFRKDICSVLIKRNSNVNSSNVIPSKLIIIELLRDLKDAL